MVPSRGARSDPDGDRSARTDAPAPDYASDGEDDLTIEQLAAATGVAFTTIRLYQHKGLLPAPQRRGRVGYYGAAHRARLELIASLQERGYSLAAIKELIDTWQDGRSLTQVLGLEATAARALGTAPELRMRPEQLAERFPGVDLTPEAMQRAYELGLVAFDDGEIVVADPAFLDVGAALAAMGVPVDEILDEYQVLQGRTHELATRFTAMFDRNLWAPFVARGMPADELGVLADSLAELSPLAERVVVSSLRRAIAEEARQFLAERAKDLE